MADTITESGTRLRVQIAEEVRALLGRRRMSDIALARKIARSHSYVYRRLAGETAFDADDLEAIAEVLGVEPHDLLPRRVTTQYPDLVTGGYEPSAIPAQRVAATPVPDLAARHMTLLPGGPLAVTHPAGGWRPVHPASHGPPPSPRRTAPTGT